MRTSRVGAALPLVVCATAVAAVQTFNDRAAWLAAVGPVSASEDFSGFVVDTEFRTQVVGLAGGMSITQTGPNTAAFRNLIDIPPLGQTDNNGTANASCFTNADDSPGVPTGILISFATNARAWGGETWGARSGEFMAMDILGAGGVVLGTIEPSNNAGQFSGFWGNAGEQFTGVRFRSINTTVGGGGEGFGMDNLAIVHIPTPGGATLLAMAAAAGLRRRR